eukprot:681878-Amphidinium_carterae.2
MSISWLLNPLQDCESLHADVHDLHTEIDEHKTKVLPMFDELSGRADTAERDIRVAQAHGGKNQRLSQKLFL